MWSLKRNKKGAPNNVAGASSRTQTNNSQRSWLVWLLSAGTFVGTVLVVLGVFWVGRWGWRQVQDKPQPKVPVVQKNPPSAPAQPNQNKPDTQTNSGQTAGGATTPNPTPTVTDLPHTGPDSDE